MFELVLRCHRHSRDLPYHNSAFAMKGVLESLAMEVELAPTSNVVDGVPERAIWTQPEKSKWRRRSHPLRTRLLPAKKGLSGKETRPRPSVCPADWVCVCRVPFHHHNTFLCETTALLLDRGAHLSYKSSSFSSPFMSQVVPRSAIQRFLHMAANPWCWMHTAFDRVRLAASRA
jgi:hypothetical protein